MRKTIRQLAGIVAADAVNSPVYSFVCVAGNKGVRGMLIVTLGATAYEVAGDNGRIKVFGTVDDAVKAAAKIHESNSGDYQIMVETGALFASPAPADPEAYYEGLIAKLGKAKTAQQARLADIDALLVQMTGWGTGNAAQVARFNEVTEQSATVNGDIAAIDAEVTRLQGLLGAR